MKLFEHEGKDILARAAVRVPRGSVAASPWEALEVAQSVGPEVVIKAQILQGGRGKAGGVRFASSPEEAGQLAGQLLGQKVKSETVHRVLVEERLVVSREMYVSVTIDPPSGSPVVMASSIGGVDIEEIAQRAPEQVVTETVNIFRGLMPFQARRICFRMGLSGKEVNAVSDILLKLYKLFRAYDAEMVEINPLIVTADAEFIAADAKVAIYDNALFRQRDFVKTADYYEDEREYRAAEYGLSYVKLDGNIGVLCAGAGLTMTTLDLIEYYGGKPANFLEFGGANYNKSYHALELVLDDPKVKVIVINTFALVARTDVISRGLVEAINKLKPHVPIVASVRGTGEDEARRILLEGAGIESLPNMEEAVREAVRIASGG